jgi:predicted MFS family arabinose efflux permease
MRNVVTLAVAGFFAAFGQVTMVVLAGIIGALLAPDARLATLPVTSGVLGVALATAPAALAMARFGRKRVFMAGAVLASFGCLLASIAIGTAAFWLYCLANLMIGSNLAFTAQFRFAAAESVTADRVSRVVAWVMLGTLAAAAVAPRLVVAVRDAAEVEYVASFWLLAAVYLTSAAVLMRFRNTQVHQDSSDQAARPLREIAAQPAFQLAILSAAIGYGVMALIMTATPLSMHIQQGHSVESTALVIQGHVIAMYLPSLVSGWLVARLGVLRMLLLGAACQTVCVGFALAGAEIMHYGGAMILLGVGWNLLFVAGTTLLTRSYIPAERFRAQALNESVIFSVMALASLLAGVLISALGWTRMNLLALIPLVGLLALIWIYHRKQALSDPASVAASTSS